MDRSAPETMRIDKWLWAARFYKTRALATRAVTGGKVHMNGERIKPARKLAPGDRLAIRKGSSQFEITVERLSLQRRPVPEARTLFSESEESVQTRHALYRERKLQGASATQRERRPDKRTRRLIHRFKQQ